MVLAWQQPKPIEGTHGLAISLRNRFNAEAQHRRMPRAHIRQMRVGVLDWVWSYDAKQNEWLAQQDLGGEFGEGVHGAWMHSLYLTNPQWGHATAGVIDQLRDEIKADVAEKAPNMDDGMKLVRARSLHVASFSAALDTHCCHGHHACV